jgi:hypothetical protein
MKKMFIKNFYHKGYNNPVNSNPELDSELKILIQTIDDNNFIDRWKAVGELVVGL